MMTLPAFANSSRRAGIASASIPCLVRAHKTRFAPASRNRDVSLPPLRSRSSSTDQACSLSFSAQSQGSVVTEQTPCPNCVIFTASHRISGMREIRPATTLVLPTFLECPPITTIAIFVNQQIAPHPYRRGFVLSGDRVGIPTISKDPFPPAAASSTADVPKSTDRDAPEHTFPTPS